MKKTLMALIALCSFSVYAETIKHRDCRLNITDVVLTDRAQIDLQKKGYALFDSNVEVGTLNLNINGDGKYFENESGWIMDKTTYQISISDVSASGDFTIFESSTSYSTEWQERGQELVKKDTRAINKLLKRIPKCVIKN